MAPPVAPVLDVAFASGNCWAPPVTVYVPTEAEEIKRMQAFEWHEREKHYNRFNPAQRQLHYTADGVLRELRLGLNFRVKQKHEFGLATNVYLLTTGKVPTAFLTSDQFIEWFHSDIYHDPDPFGRRMYGFNQAGIRFRDQEGRELAFSNGAFFVPRSELKYLFYPAWFNAAGIAVKTALHLGLNHHRFNSSLDGGVSATAIKLFRCGSNRSLQVGFSPGLVRRKLHYTGNNPLLIEAKTGVNLQGIFRYNWLQGSSLNSISVSFNGQSAYYTDDKNLDFWILTGNRYTTHWAVTINHLFRNLQTWTLAYQFSRKLGLTVYIQEDLLVNNGPDLQLGFSVRVPLAPDAAAD